MQVVRLSAWGESLTLRRQYRSRRYGKNSGWSTQSRSRCGNHGCDGRQGAIIITSAAWEAGSFWMTLLNRGNGGYTYIDLPCQSWDRASTASNWGSGIGDMNWCRRVLWTVANMSTSGVPQNWNIRSTTSGCRLHSVEIGWLGCDRWSAITFKQPGMCLALRMISWACSHIKRSTTRRNKDAEWVTPCLLI